MSSWQESTGRKREEGRERLRGGCCFVFVYFSSVESLFLQTILACVYSKRTTALQTISLPLPAKFFSRTSLVSKESPRALLSSAASTPYQSLLPNALTATTLTHHAPFSSHEVPSAVRVSGDGHAGCRGNAPSGDHPCARLHAKGAFLRQSRAFRVADIFTVLDNNV